MHFAIWRYLPISMEMFIENPGDSYAVYRVDEDGVLSFAGGVDAHDRKYTWSGPMTSEEIDRLHALLDEHRWFESGPKSSGTPPGRRYEIELSKPGVVRDFAVLGDGPSISPIFDLLETAARRRHEQFMQTLPKPGQQE